MSLLIKNVHIMDPKTKKDGVYNLGIQGESICEITENQLKNNYSQIIDGSGLILAPGFIDAHVHLRVPGQENKETLLTGTKAALKGGFTSVATMPNTNPVIDNHEVLSNVKKLIKDQALMEVYPIVSVTKGQNGKSLVDFNSLVHETVAFSDDGMPIMSDSVLEKAFQLLPNEGVIISHCEDFNISKNFPDTPWPPIAESKMVLRNLKVAHRYQKRIHIAHISCQESLDHIIEYKKKGTKVTCEVTPHHFSLSSDTVDLSNPYSKVNPPIRSEENRIAMIKGIKGGYIDMIATDHAPHEKEKKEVSYNEAAFGISGIEYAFPLAYTHLVQSGEVSLMDVIEMLTTKPAQLLGLDRGSIEVGKKANLVLIDLNKKDIISPNKFVSKGKNTPLYNYKVQSLIKMTIESGRIKYQRSDV